MLISGKPEYVNKSKVSMMMETCSKNEFASLPSPRILNNHLHPRHLPTDFFKRNRKIVMVLRNPKDVAVSFYSHTYLILKIYHYNGEFKDYLNNFISGKGKLFSEGNKYPPHPPPPTKKKERWKSKFIIKVIMVNSKSKFFDLPLIFKLYLIVVSEVNPMHNL